MEKKKLDLKNAQANYPFDWCWSCNGCVVNVAIWFAATLLYPGSGE